MAKVSHTRQNGHVEVVKFESNGANIKEIYLQIETLLLKYYSIKINYEFKNGSM